MAGAGTGAAAESSGTFSVRMKWNGKMHEGIEVNVKDSVETLKTQIWMLTGVPVERQKLMARGLWRGVLKNDVALASIPWKKDALMLMMGTSEGVPIISDAEKEKFKFVEDMAEKDQINLGAALPPGLVNLGNTCYLNATVQCLKKCTELRTALGNSASVGNSDGGLTLSLRNLYNEMDTLQESVTPSAFVGTLRRVFPQFAAMSRGGYQQQDADEFYNELCALLARTVPKEGNEGIIGDAPNVVDALFGIDVSIKLKCKESEDEPVIAKSDSLRRLQCTITSDVNHLSEGVMLGFKGDLEKRSELLGRNAIWSQEKRISKLPRYLMVQLNRFYWKLTPESRDHTGVNCKMLRPVAFPMQLDVYEMCDERLQSILNVQRKKYSDEAMVGASEKKKDAAMETDEAAASSSSAASVDDVDLQKALAMSMEVEEGATAGIGLPKEFSGVYELCGVVTHKGRASDSGHYMGWVRQEGDNWLCFDDESASPCKTDDIKVLKGGGDYHMAYMLLYRFKVGDAGTSSEKKA